MRSMQWQLGILGTISAFDYRQRETKKNLCRGGGSQDLPNTDFQPAVGHLNGSCLFERHGPFIVSEIIPNNVELHVKETHITVRGKIGAYGANVEIIFIKQIPTIVLYLMATPFIHRRLSWPNCDGGKGISASQRQKQRSLLRQCADTWRKIELKDFL